MSKAFWIVAALVLAADQASKYAVSHLLVVGQSVPVIGPFHITYVTNTGAAFGILSGQSTFLTVVRVAVVALLLFFYRRLAGTSRLMRYALGLVLGGSLGNLADTLRLGYVVDFLDFTYWPAFNVADSSVVVGVILLAYSLVFSVARDKGSP